MNERMPSNLEILYGAFSKDAIDRILPGDTFTIDGVEFVCKYAPESTADRFYIVKPLALVERYRHLSTGPWHNARIVELGIAEGGSTALLALLAEPAKLVALDIEVQPLGALTEFVDRRGLADVVRPYYGVDQADRARLTEIVDAELGENPLDIVIDDASHAYELTRSSFETLFPRLRPGGMFVIEDWNAAHTMRDAIRAGLRDPSGPDHDERLEAFRESLRAKKKGRTSPPTPLSRLAVELLLTRASLGDAIASVAVDEYWLSVVRGSEPLDAASFALDDLYRDYFGFLPAIESDTSPDETSG